MSTSFSLSRLGKLIRKQLYENLRFYTFSLLALIGLLAISFTLYLMFGGPNYHEENTWMIGLFGLFFSGTVFASMSFNMLSSKDRGTYWLGIPATHFEKLVCTIFYTTILFSIAYALSFFGIRQIFIAILESNIKDNPKLSYREMVDLKQGFGEVLPYFILGFYAVQSLYFLGSVYFTKYSFVVTTVVGAVLFFAFGLYMSKIQHGMFGKGIDWEIFSAEDHTIAQKGSHLVYSVSSGLEKVFINLAKYMWATLLWLVTWYRLKEKEM
jgi:hypothetical protein